MKVASVILFLITGYCWWATEYTVMNSRTEFTLLVCMYGSFILGVVSIILALTNKERVE